jgi:hypothetical protein
MPTTLQQTMLPNSSAVRLPTADLGLKFGCRPFFHMAAKVLIRNGFLLSKGYFRGAET